MVFHPCRTALRVLIVVLLVPLTLATAARAFGWEAGPLGWIVAMTPWTGAAVGVVLVLALFSRSLVLVLVSAVLLAAHVAWQLPLFVAADRDAPVAVTVMTLNLRNGTADAASVVDLVRDHHVQVLALEELTPDLRQRLTAAGLDRLLPYAFARPMFGFTGTGIWSRSPLSDTRELPGFVSHQLVAQTEVAGQRTTFVAVHPIAPRMFDPRQWQQEYARLGTALDQVEGPLMVAGDFNATRDQATFRTLLDGGLSDAADQAGAGLQFTFPQGRRFPPLVTIDHVLVRDSTLTAVEVTVTPVLGSDHRAVIVGYASG
jgi:endonuclease/exonuclease/phosphatase (EEP) superfamily protein YafD